jgi:hypothetical protein
VLVFTLNKIPVPSILLNLILPEPTASNNKSEPVFDVIDKLPVEVIDEVEMLFTPVRLFDESQSIPDEPIVDESVPFVNAFGVKEL